MAWDFIRKIFAIQPVEKPDLEAQKLIWNDAAQIEAKVLDIVAKTLGFELEKVKPDTSWRDLIVSLEGLEVFMLCEEVFGIDIPDTNPDDKNGEWNTVGQLTTYIQRALGVRERQI